MTKEQTPQQIELNIIKIYQAEVGLTAALIVDLIEKETGRRYHPTYVGHQLSPKGQPMFDRFREHLYRTFPDLAKRVAAEGVTLPPLYRASQERAT